MLSKTIGICIFVAKLKLLIIIIIARLTKRQEALEVNGVQVKIGVTSGQENGQSCNVQPKKMNFVFKVHRVVSALKFGQ